MINKLTSQFIISIKIFVLMVAITGIAYTSIVTLLGNILFQKKINGSLILKNQNIIGSKLIAQKFSSAKYFWVRPSACDYNTIPSSGSNLGATSKNLNLQINRRIKDYSIYYDTKIPLDMLSSSASGLDPDISPESAYYQIPRIAKARYFSDDQIKKLKLLIQNQIQKKTFDFIGEERINVLELNLLLDRIDL